jgi:adenine-specific DNA methylase
MRIGKTGAIIITTNSGRFESKVLEEVPERSMIERDLDTMFLLPMARNEGNRKKPIYEMHKWWARRLGINFRTFLIASTLPSNKHDVSLGTDYYSHHDPSDITVLDPFMGGGTSLVEAAKLGARVLGNDIDPMAWFITKKEMDAWDEFDFKREFTWMNENLAEKLRSYFKTKDEQGNLVDVTYYFWVEIIPCPHCGTDFEGHIHYFLCDDGPHYTERRRVAFCHNCHAIREVQDGENGFDCTVCGAHTDCYDGPMGDQRYHCPMCGQRGSIKELYPRKKPFNKKLFALEYVDVDGKPQYKRADEFDIELYNKAKKDLRRLRKTLLIPKARIPTRCRLDKRPINFGYHRYEQMFNDRQLLCLGLILNEIVKISDQNTREFMLLAFSDSLAANNWFCSYAFGYRKMTPLFGIHSYRKILRPVEGNVWGSERGRGSFSNCVQKIIKGKRFGEKTWEYEVTGKEPKKIWTAETCNILQTIVPDSNGTTEDPRAIIRCGNSKNLSWIKAHSVDIILTDPPYYDNLPYSEMADFYYVWLKDIVQWPSYVHLHSPMGTSLVVNPRNNGKDHTRFADGLADVFKECHRVLKPNGLMIFTYHHKKPSAWMALTEALKVAEFNVVNVFPVLSEGKSGFHSSDGSLKWDEVLVCRPTERIHTKRMFRARLTERIDEEANAWILKIRDAGTLMGEGDELSLKMGLLTAHITRTNVDKKEIKDLFEQYNTPVKGKQTQLAILNGPGCN